MGYLDKLQPVASSSAASSGAGYKSKLQPVTETQQAPQDLLTKASNIASAVFPAKNIGNVIGTKLARLTATPEEQKYIKDDATKMGVLGDVAQNALYFTPIGRALGLAEKGVTAVLPKLAGTAAKTIAATATGAATGYGIDVANSASQNDLNFKPGLGTAIGTVLPVAGTALAATARKTGEAMGGTASRVINSLIKPLNKQFTYGKDPGRAVSELGITGNSMEELAANISKAKNTIGAEIGRVADSLPHGAQGISITATDAVKPFDEALQKAVANNDQPLFNRLNEAKSAVTQIFSTSNGKIIPVGSRVMENLSYKQALELKQRLGTLTKWTGAKTEDETVNGALSRAYGTIKAGMNKAADQYAPEIATKMKKLNEQFADLTGAEIATKYRDILEQRHNMVNLPGKIGLVGSLLAAPFTGGVSAILAVIASIGLDKALSSPAFKTRLAKWLAKASPAEKAALIKGAPQLEKFLSPGDLVADSVGKYLKKNPPSLGLSLKDVSGGVASFKGFEDLSTKLVEKLKGRSVVSKQFIEDLTNSADMKQAEKDLVRTILKEQPEKINVTDFANKVKTELLPLDRREVPDAHYENISLPEDSRGPIANYAEHIYNSPIKTSAGNVHFSDEENYFAHTRVEDLPKELKGFTPNNDMQAWEHPTNPTTDYDKGTTRRVIELQSDLFQKGRLEGEVDPYMISKDLRNKFESEGMTPNQAQNAAEVELRKGATKSREAEVAKLEPYKNTWHERLVREEVKQAALDGKTKLQFPTGETAMKIEGLGDTNKWWDVSDVNTAKEITPDDLKVGKEIRDGVHDWYITDVLGDGKFKAVSKLTLDNDYGLYEAAKKAGYVTEEGGIDLAKLMKDKEMRKVIEQSNLNESFDISGKVDESNPIYKFYDKEVAKYLKNKYNAQLITDPQGVKWWEVSVKPEYKKLPIEAFGAGGLLLPKKDEKKLPAKPAKLN